jgi:galactoside O-acetyltransferase
MIYEPCLILKPEMVHVSQTARIDSFCKIEGGKGVRIGEFVHIASFSHINVGGGEVVFGDHSGCSSHCCIGSASPDWSYLYISAAEPSEHHHVRRYRTVIGEYALLGMGVIVVPGRTVGEGAVVKPGSVVFDDVAPWTIVEGNPAIQAGVRKVTSKDERDSRISIPKRHFVHLSLYRADG